MDDEAHVGRSPSPTAPDLGTALALPITHKRRVEAADGAFVSATPLGGPLLSRSELLAEVKRRPEWGHVRTTLTPTRERAGRLVLTVRCRESTACPCFWQATYFVKAFCHAAGTLLIRKHNEHDHAAEIGRAHV